MNNFSRNFDTNQPLYDWIEASAGSSERFSPLWQSRFVEFGAWHYPGSYDPTSYPDFALFRLNSHFSINSRLIPIRLPRWSDRNRSFFGSQIQLIGWGELAGSAQATHLQFANFTVNFNPTLCGTPSAISLPGYFLCMTRGVNGASSQWGDEGAPFVYTESDGILTLVGIHSMFNVANNRIYGVNLSFFLNFISLTAPSIPIRS